MQGDVGLGLAIVKMLVEAHGGTIAAHRAPGCGIRFSIWLPVRMPEELSRYITCRL